MAKVKFIPRRPPQKKARARVSINHMIKVCTSIPPQDIVKELKRLRPARDVLIRFLATLQSVGASNEIVTEVLKYCGERGCDPTQPPVAKFYHKTPEAGLVLTYNVQYTRQGRPYLRLPLDPLGEPKHVRVKYDSEAITLQAG